MNLRFRIFRLFKSGIRKNQLQFKLEILSTFWVKIRFFGAIQNKSFVYFFVILILLLKKQ
jgi:hypothetical protein